MVTRIRGGTVDGIDGFDVLVEIDAGRGLPAFHIVGLPNAAVRESRERVMAAVRNSGRSWPTGRVVVSLAPADVRKEGASLDLAIAVGICIQQEAQPVALDWRRTVFLGELSLSGTLRPVRGVLAMIKSVRESGCTRCVLPSLQLPDAKRIQGLEFVGVHNLNEALDWVRYGRVPARDSPPAVCIDSGHGAGSEGDRRLFASMGEAEQRLIQVAAGGRHHLLMHGAPGGGKTSLARLIGALQPVLTEPEALEVNRIHGVTGLNARASSLTTRPFRAPHHSVTRGGLLGLGVSGQVGEITLAHLGVLFLDEIAEFSPAVLDLLREPMETGQIVMSRSGRHRIWPSDFQLIAAMNPCRCGLSTSSRGHCRCTALEIARYRNRLSGPLLDRLDLMTDVDGDCSWSLDESCDPRSAERRWTEASGRVQGTWQRWRRLAAAQGGSEGRFIPDLDFCRNWLDADCRDYLDQARSSLGLSVRGAIRSVAVAGTLAFLDDHRRPDSGHLAEALSLRSDALST
jgi:magnesium chelatase family protein